MGSQPILRVVFFLSQSGRKPVRKWLLNQSQVDRRAIGCDIKTVQYGWPLGMPLIRKLKPVLWEVRSAIDHGIARTFFTVEADTMVRLHGFIKKSAKTPANELKAARERLAQLRGSK